MNVIKLYGGLGNQMFQYALGKTIEKIGQPVAYEISFFNRPQDPPRLLSLNKFKVNLKISSFLQQITVHEKDFYNFTPDVLMAKDVNLLGYWQHLKYIETVLPELKEEFRLLPDVYTEEYTLYKEMVIARETAALHVRRGDYVRINGHVLEPMDYYKKALKKVKGQLLIFSDDLPWCKENFKQDALFVDLPDYLCFDIFRRCSHKILANSTFSLWAALLNDIGSTIVPNQWRENLEEQTKLRNGGLLKTNWITI